MSNLKILKYVFVLLLVTNKADAFLGGFINKVHSKVNNMKNNFTNRVRSQKNNVMRIAKKFRGKAKHFRGKAKHKARMNKILAKKFRKKIKKVPQIRKLIPKNINKAKNMLGKILNGSGFAPLNRAFGKLKSNIKGSKTLKYINQVRSVYNVLQKIVTHKNPSQMVVRLARQGQMGESVKENLVQGVDILGSIQSRINEYAFSREPDQQAEMIKKIVINPLNEKADSIEDPKDQANTKLMAENVDNAVKQTLLQIQSK